MNIAEFSVHRPVTTIMIIMSVIVLGLFSLKFLPLNALPDVSFPNLSVNVPYGSSSPQEVEKLITIPLEDALSTITHLKKMTSESGGSFSRVNLELDTGTDMDIAAMEVRDRIDQIRNDLPRDIRNIGIWRFQPTDMPIMNINVSIQGDKAHLYDLVKNVLIRQLERIDGVANVEVRGSGDRAIFVDIDQKLLQSHGIDLYTLYQSIRDNNRNISSGFVYDGGKKYLIRILGEYQRIDEIAETPIRGYGLRLREVANVRYDFPEQKWFRRLNGKEATMLSVRKNSVANTVEVANRIKAKLKEFEKDPRLEGLSTLIFRDQSQEIMKGLNGLRDAGLLGALFSAIVLYFFLRKVRTTLIIELAVPISMIGAILFMYLARTFFGSTISLNMISLSGLIVCVGMLVDNSIVVLENIYRHKQEGTEDAKVAAVEGAKEVTLAVFAATMTATIVFVPIIFMSGDHMMIFMRDFGTVVCVALLSSLVIALTLVPLLSSRFFVGAVTKRPPFIVWMMNTYARIMLWSLHFRSITIAIAVTSFILSYYLFTKIERSYSFSPPQRQIDYTIKTPRSYIAAELQSFFGGIEKSLLDRKDELDIRDVAMDYGIGQSGSMFSHGNRLTIYLKDVADSKNASALIVQKKIQALLPERPGIIYQLGYSGHGGEEAISLNLKGYNMELLSQYSERLKAELAGIEGIRNVETSMERGDEEINITVNRDLAQKHGITPRQVASTIFSALSTRATTYFKSQNGEIAITVRYQEADRSNIRDLQNMTFENTNGEMIPISTVVNYQIRRGPESIRREDRRTIASIYAVSERRGVYVLQQKILDKLNTFRLPPGYTWELGEAFTQTAEFEKSSYFALGMALALIYIIMAALFESFIHPFTILFSVPFALLGVFILFILTNTSYNNMSFLGILILAGIVVNNGIILVDYINQLRKKGMPRNEAIIEGGKIRLRPILMTASATILGIMPMVMPVIFPNIFGPVEGRAGMYGTIGIAIMGGMLTSTALTLIIMPTIYSLMDDFSNGVMHLIRKVFA